MTKMAVVKNLFNQGFKQKEIVEKTDFSYRTVSSYLYIIRNPESVKAVINPAAKIWREKNKDKIRIYAERGRKKFRKKYPEKRAESRRKNILNHQNATLPNAENHYQRWTIQEIEYLEKHGKTKTIEEIAIKLERSYLAIQMAGHRFGIDLRGNKTKTHSTRS